MTVPRWLAIARTDIGLREIPGAATAPKIAAWLQDLGAWWRDDETPWCGVACGAWFKACGIAVPKHFYRARAWLDWGSPIAVPVVGCVVVFDGGKSRPGAGHVGIVEGVDQHGNLMVLGGNQGNAVSIMPFDREPIGFRLPYHMEPLLLARLPVIHSATDVSRREA